MLRSTLHFSMVALDFQPGVDKSILLDAMSQAKRKNLQLLTFVMRKKDEKLRTDLLKPMHMLVFFYGFVSPAALGDFNPQIQLHFFLDPSTMNQDENDYLVIASDPRRRPHDELLIDMFKSVSFNSNLEPDAFQKCPGGHEFPGLGGDTIILLRGRRDDIIRSLEEIGLKIVHLMRYQAKYKGEEEMAVEDLRKRLS